MTEDNETQAEVLAEKTMAILRGETTSLELEEVPLVLEALECLLERKVTISKIDEHSAEIVAVEKEEEDIDE